jgi:hypothetical protein
MKADLSKRESRYFAGGTECDGILLTIEREDVPQAFRG